MFSFYNNESITITGTNGKSTTAKILHDALIDQKRDSRLIGNIGNPALSEKNITKKTIFVIEASSYQLDYSSVFRSKYAIILNITADHIESDINIFLEENTSKKILISGNNGKSTVCSWLEKLFNYQNLDTLAIGNIGRPVLEFVEEKKDFFVLEVSSFHLDIAPLPKFKLSVLLNITPDHIDRHGSFNEYATIKKKISDSSEISIVNENLKEFIPQADYFFSNKGSVKDQNFNAIKEICSCLNLNFLEKDILNCFAQLPHRMELFHQLDGNITFIDDSKATNVASSLEGLKSVDESKSLIVFCGGRSKDQDFKSFTDYLNKRAKKIYYFGESTKILKKLLDSSKSQEVSNLEEAVHSALKIIESDTVMILSPACSSLDMFESFEERGKKFKDLVLNAKI